MIIRENVEALCEVVLNCFGVLYKAFREARDEDDVRNRILLHKASAVDVDSLSTKLGVDYLFIPPCFVRYRANFDITRSPHGEGGGDQVELQVRMLLLELPGGNQVVVLTYL